MRTDALIGPPSDRLRAQCMAGGTATLMPCGAGTSLRMVGVDD